ncbi:hypothetical protein ACHAXS_002301 [Conticribra weissflogii]
MFVNGEAFKLRSQEALNL